MKLTTGIVLAAAVVSLSLPALAKEKGTPEALSGWGVVMVPDGLYMEEGQQPMITAKEYGNDMAAMIEEIYPIEPAASYQVVQKDGAAFQYGCLLRYSPTVWEVEAALSRRKTENAYLRDIGSRPEMKDLMAQAADMMAQSLPSGFRVVAPVTGQKKNGRMVYTCTLERKLFLNETVFSETIRVLAWQRDTTIETALIFGESGSSLIPTVETMLMTATVPKR